MSFWTWPFGTATSPLASLLQLQPVQGLLAGSLNPARQLPKLVAVVEILMARQSRTPAGRPGISGGISSSRHSS